MSSTQPSYQKLDKFSDAICLKNVSSDLSRLSDWVGGLGDALNFSPKVIFGIELVLSEAVTNIIDNAYEDNFEHEINLTFTQIDGRITVDIIDDGKSFNPLDYPQLSMPESIEDAQVGGLGIHLIRSYTDDCTYRRESGKNHLTVTMNICPE